MMGSDWCRHDTSVYDFDSISGKVSAVRVIFTASHSSDWSLTLTAEELLLESLPSLLSTEQTEHLDSVSTC